MMKWGERRAKWWLWRLAGPVIIALVDRFVNDRAFANDGRFVDAWSKRHLVVESLRYDRDPVFMGLLPSLVCHLAHRKDLYTFWQIHGASIYPNDYISPLPDLTHLDESDWPRAFDAAGLDYGADGQARLLADVFPRYIQECRYPSEPTGNDAEFHKNPMFGSVDAEVLYCLVRHHRPRRIIEVGSGFSTRMIASACNQNAKELGWRTLVTAIDPVPRASLSALAGVVEHDRRPVEDVPKEYFDSLNHDDILFIDSSHIVRPGGDVVYLYLEILPRLKPGVMIHVHDIFLPLDYPRDIIFDNHWFLTEQYLLHAFLLYNNAFKIVWASKYMMRTQESLMNACFGTTGGSSLWLRRGDEVEAPSN